MLLKNRTNLGKSRSSVHCQSLICSHTLVRGSFAGPIDPNPDAAVRCAAMSKFHVKVKLQGFELEIQGNREDAPAIGRSIGEQFSAIISPAVDILEGNSP